FADVRLPTSDFASAGCSRYHWRQSVSNEHKDANSPFEGGRATHNRNAKDNRSQSVPLLVKTRSAIPAAASEKTSLLRVTNAMSGVFERPRSIVVTFESGQSNVISSG